MKTRKPANRKLSNPPRITIETTLELRQQGYRAILRSGFVSFKDFIETKLREEIERQADSKLAAQKTA